jgi:hypothetical protein
VQIGNASCKAPAIGTLLLQQASLGLGEPVELLVPLLPQRSCCLCRDTTMKKFVGPPLLV